MSATVIHHSADYDGIFCGEIARKFLPGATIIGWDYGDKRVPVTGGTVYILDLSPECLDEASMWGQDIIWIDHHKSAILKFDNEISGYRIDGVAACRLAWQWFTYEFGPHNPHVNPADYELPIKSAYIDRNVSEPLAVRLAGEYDIWDKRDPRAELFQHGLRSRDLEPWWSALLGDEGSSSISLIEELMASGKKFELLPNGNVRMPGLGERVVENLLRRGEAIQYAQTRQNESVIKEIGFTFQWEGLTFLGCNASRYNSHLFTAGLKPEHDGCFGFKWTGTGWSVSLYHAPGKEHHDLSTIAVKYGGGGHRGACGFRTNKLPFL
jgi:hypothetical protein